MQQHRSSGNEERREHRREVHRQWVGLMTAVFKASVSEWPNNQLSSVMQLDSCETLCIEYHVCTS